MPSVISIVPPKILLETTLPVYKHNMNKISSKLIFLINLNRQINRHSHPTSGVFFFNKSKLKSLLNCLAIKN